MDSVNQAAFKDAFGGCAHLWFPHTQRQYWLNVGDGLGPGYAVHAEHHTEHKVIKVYCQHCLEVREINGRD